MTREKKFMFSAFRDDLFDMWLGKIAFQGRKTVEMNANVICFWRKNRILFLSLYKK